MAFFAGLLGLVMGSFMNVLIYRLPRGKSIISPGSSCVSCGSPVRWRDNIPVLGWLLLRGRCRNCGSGISFFYPLVELTTCAVFVLIYLKFGAGARGAGYAFLCFILLAASFTDIETALDKNFETGVIPVVYPALGAAAALCFAFYCGRFSEALAGWAAGYLVLYIPACVYSALRGAEGMGEGDFTLLALIGAFTGPAGIPAVLTIGAFLGVAAGFAAIAATGNRRYPIPFAPMLSAGGIIYLFFENTLKISF